MDWDNVERIRKARIDATNTDGQEIADTESQRPKTDGFINTLQNPLERLIFRVRTELINYVDSKGGSGGGAVNDVLLDSKTIVDANGIARLNKSAIKKSYEANSNTNAFTDDEKAALSQATQDITTLQSSISELGNEVNTTAGRIATIENSAMKLFNFKQDISAKVNLTAYSDGQYNASLAFEATLKSESNAAIWTGTITLFGTIQVTSGTLSGCSLYWANETAGLLRSVSASKDVVQFTIDQTQNLDSQVAYVGIGTSTYAMTVFEAGGGGGGGTSHLELATLPTDAAIIVVKFTSAVDVTMLRREKYIDLQSSAATDGEELDIFFSMAVGQTITFYRQGATGEVTSFISEMAGEVLDSPYRLTLDVSYRSGAIAELNLSISERPYIADVQVSPYRLCVPIITYNNDIPQFSITDSATVTMYKYV